MNKIIRPISQKPGPVKVPGSKSLTHRMLVAAALAEGKSSIANALQSQDTKLTAQGLACLGAGIRQNGHGVLEVSGVAGKPAAWAEPVFLNNSGTSMRFLTAVAALGRGAYTLAGAARMHERPINDLVNALRSLGVPARAMSPGGCPPVMVQGSKITKNSVAVNCSVSSQFLSALLLIGPCTPKGLSITVEGDLVSRPYVDLTLDVMEKFGAKIDRQGYERFSVSGGHSYQPGEYTVETDASNASYFFAAGAVSGIPVTVANISRQSLQGDIRFLAVLEKMGAAVSESEQGVTVCGKDLTGVTVDMGDMPDMVPTLAVVAAFAKGETRISNVAHLRAKESDRLDAVATELSRMGISVYAGKDELVITGGTPQKASIRTYEDHRMAMSFAVAGLKVPGLVITEAFCVEKSFPDFWDVWEKLY
ncbi:MAG: 3-phosphoshikimate 1-carboxyvinyltransferase [Desulfatibacillaceae bacterium]|nr:3-phosphoshikimate 1-carboxyvinyltransferase [Desulfatibacillaceae bacterium]